RFLKWAARGLVTQRPRTEVLCMHGVNRVVLVGTVGKYGVTVKYAQSGTPCANFTLVLSEQGQDGKPHQTFIDCEGWGKKAEAAGEREAGELCLFEGKLAKRKKNEQWELVVAGFELMPIVAPVANMTGSPN